MKSKTAQPSTDSSFAQFEREHVRPNPGRTLIVGSAVYRDKEDRRKRYADVLGLDMLAGPGVDMVHDLEEPLPEQHGQFEHVECMSVLEHVRRPWLLAANIERAMLPGASIYVTVPFVWRIHGYPDDYWRLTPNGVRMLFGGIRWERVMLASVGLQEASTKLAVHKEPYPYLPRTEVVAFGFRAGA